MKLNELSGYKQAATSIGKNWSSVSDDQYLKQQGLKHINSGDYGSVWGFGNPNWVLKVFKKDSAYLYWIKQSLAHSKNPYFPKFKGKLVDINGSNEVNGIIIERLTDTPPEVYGMFELKYTLYEMYIHEWDSQNPFNVNSNPELDSWLTDKFNQQRIKLNKANFDKILSQILADKNFIQMFNSVNNENFVNDLKLKNTMMRGNQLVITDPLAAFLED